MEEMHSTNDTIQVRVGPSRATAHFLAFRVYVLGFDHLHSESAQAVISCMSVSQALGPRISPDPTAPHFEQYILLYHFTRSSGHYL